MKIPSDPLKELIVKIMSCGVKATSFVIYLTIFCFQIHANREETKDQTTCRANTLFDDADDIQRQLDNEVRDKYSKFKTVWVFHVPSRNSLRTTTPSYSPTVRSKRKMDKLRFNSFNMLSDQEEAECKDKCKEKLKEEESLSSHVSFFEAPPQPSEPEWSFSDQQSWHQKYKECAGRAQSPVNLPVNGLIRVRGARKLVFANYDVTPWNLTVVNDGIRVMLFGTWPKDKWPLVYGGAAHSRRYLFHSLTVYWPSEHPVGGNYYPMETQLLHISSEYGSFDEAVEASSKDPLAFLGVSNIYKYAETSHTGVMQILHAAKKCYHYRMNIPPVSLDKFSAPFSDHACYYGSLTFPPCSESVLWMIRRKTLPLSRETSHLLENILRPPDREPSLRPQVGDVRKLTIRTPQPLNDRQVFLIL